MNVAVITDVHGNLQALQAILDDIARTGIERIWCLGDMVGYGADPEACVRLLREHTELVVAGNHEWALLDRFDVSRFNPIARYCIEWGRTRISGDSREWLSSLGLSEVRENCRLVHAKLPDLERFEYPRSLEDGRDMLACCEEQVILFGHTHKPVSWWKRSDGELDGTYHETGMLSTGERLVINPGSAGQPRNNSPAVSWLELAPGEVSWRFHSVHYDVQGAVARLREEDLPEVLVQALLQGVDD